MTERTGRFSWSDRLLVSRDYRRVSRKGSRFASCDFIVLVAAARIEEAVVRPDSGPVRRLGITASRKMGNAVVRNRVKRGVREWFRHRRSDLAPDVDVVVIARGRAGMLATPEIGAALDEILSLADGDEMRSVHAPGR